MRTKTISEILNRHETYFVCKHCGAEYMAFSEIAKEFCIICQQDQIKEYKSTIKFLDNLKYDYDEDMIGVTD